MDLDLDEEYVLHQCERRVVGAEPVLEVLHCDDCNLQDESLKILMIFVRTERIGQLHIGGFNPMSQQLRADIHMYNVEQTRIMNMNKGFITVKKPIQF